MAEDERLRPGDDDLPVVARLVIEIRSDGTRTIARGGLEQASGLPGPDGGEVACERIAIEARGGSPAALAGDLLRSLVRLPFSSSLARWTGRDRPAASLTATEVPTPPPRASDEPRRGLVGRVQRELAGRLRRRLGGR